MSQGKRYDLRKKPGPKPKPKVKRPMGRPAGSANRSVAPPRLLQKWADHIETAKILKRMVNHALAEEQVRQVRDAETGKVIAEHDDYLPPGMRLRGSQLRAAEILLDRVVPRLNRTMHEGNPENPVQSATSVKLDEDQLASLAEALAKRL